MSSTSAFATCLPGLGRVLEAEVADLPATRRAVLAGNDGRSDVVTFETSDIRSCNALRCAEDVYALVGDVPRSKDLRQLASRLAPLDGITRAEVAYSRFNGRPLPRRATARVIARVTDERAFRRTELRYAASRELEKARPEWYHGDPAQAELWACQTGNRSFVSGLRLTSKEFRQRGGRGKERTGALRPSVAAALVRVAGERAALPMLDPCCGSGTIAAEAITVGWYGVGSDLDAEAIGAADGNVRGAAFFRADARQLPLPSGAVGAVVSNLPFGRQFSFDGDRRSWFTSVLQEVRRVEADGASTVLLVPHSQDFMHAVKATGFRVDRRLDIDLLGTKTSAWVLAQA